MTSIPIKSAPPAPAKAPDNLKSPGLLRVADRCDRCGVRAYVAAYIGDWRTPLLFCAHHFREHEARLRAITSAIVDDRDRLAAETAAQKVPGGV